jgi:ribosomal protein S18 acetylase RimI-like enzyme
VPSLIRPYRPEDQDAVRRIYAETAFFGEPVETYFDDRELYADLGVSAYLRGCPDYIFVADDNGVIAGYVLGCPSGDVGIRKQTLRLLPAVLFRMATGRYRIGRKTLAHALAETTAALRGELLEIRSDEYPANLHINLLPEYRGRGLGSALLRTYLDNLRARGIPGVHVVSSDRNGAALRMYERFGFTVLAERTTRMWKQHVGGEVVRLIGLGLRLAKTA